MLDYLLPWLWHCFWIFVPTVMYLDATHQKIGRTEPRKLFHKWLLNIPAGAWGAAALIMGVIALPLYLIMRRWLIKKAKGQPVEISAEQRVSVAITLLTLSVALSLLSMMMVWMGD